MNDSEPGKSRSPRVFISYSHDNREHCDRVLDLAQQLRRDGIDVELDQFHQYELVHWPRWCEEQLRPENSDLFSAFAPRSINGALKAAFPPMSVRVFSGRGRSSTIIFTMTRATLVVCRFI